MARTKAFEATVTGLNRNYRFGTVNGTNTSIDFVEPSYIAVGGGYSATAVAAAPGPAIERNSFNGPGKDFDLSLTKGFRRPEMRVIGDTGFGWMHRTCST